MLKRLLYLLLIFSWSTGFADTNNICFIESSNNTYFNQTIKTFRNLTDPSLVIRRFTAESLASSDTLLCDNAIVITLGNRAATAADQFFGHKKIINSYITHAQIHALNKHSQNRIGLLLDQPLWRYFAFIDSLLDPDSIGIINNKKTLLDYFEDSFLESSLLTLNQYQANSTKNLISIARALFQENDVLLMLPDPEIYNRDTLKGILLTSYRSRKPVISYSPAHVKSGALASIFSSPEDIGRQLADILIHYNPAATQETHSEHYSTYYSIVTNPSVAYALDINLPSEESIRQHILAVSP